MCKDSKQKEIADQPVLEEQSEPMPEEQPKPVPEEQLESVLPEELKRDEPEEERQAAVRVSAQSSFVIKPRTPVSESGVVRAVTADQFLQDHPELMSPKKLSQQREPLLIISRRAEQEIKAHIAWDRKTSQNTREQGGILIGTPFLVDGRMVSVVECVIPAELSESSAVYLKMDTKTWIKMLNLYDERYQEQGLYVLGWFHTHPNSLGVFMSSTDMKTQRAFFCEDWHFAVVLNPHRRLIACFHSAQAVPCAFSPLDFADR